MKGLLTLKPVRRTPLHGLQGMFGGRHRYQLNLDQRVLLCDREQIRPGRIHCLSYVRQGVRWTPVLKLISGPLLTMGRPRSKTDACEEAQAIAKHLRLTYLSDGGQFLLESRPILRRLRAKSQLTGTQVNERSLLIPLRVKTSAGVAYGELQAERGQTLRVFNGLGQRKVLCRLSALKEVSSEVLETAEGRHFRMSLRGARVTYATTITSLGGAEDAVIGPFGLEVGRQSPPTAHLHKIVSAVRRFVELSQPGQTPPELREDLLRRLDGR